MKENTYGQYFAFWVSAKSGYLCSIILSGAKMENNVETILITPPNGKL